MSTISKSRAGLVVQDVTRTGVVQAPLSEIDLLKKQLVVALNLIQEQRAELVALRSDPGTYTELCNEKEQVKLELQQLYTDKRNTEKHLDLVMAEISRQEEVLEGQRERFTNLNNYHLQIEQLKQQMTVHIKHIHSLERHIEQLTGIKNMHDARKMLAEQIDKLRQIKQEEIDEYLGHETKTKAKAWKEELVESPRAERTNLWDKLWS